MTNDEVPIRDENVERRVYRPDSEFASLSETILEAVDAHENGDIGRDGFRLYDNVDPDALDRLFREDADADLTVRFNVDGVTVSLWGDGGVDVRVTDRHR